MLSRYMQFGMSELRSRQGYISYTMHSIWPWQCVVLTVSEQSGTRVQNARVHRFLNQVSMVSIQYMRNAYRKQRPVENTRGTTRFMFMFRGCMYVCIVGTR